MSTAPRRKSNQELRADLVALPARLTGEIIDGELYVMSRPSPAHQEVEAGLMSALKFGRGGPPPAAWYFQHEVEVLFASHELAVPDVSGWRSERIASHRNDNPIEVVPDWVCEVLSDSTRRKDLGPKRDLYARSGMAHLWLADPTAQVLEAFALTGNQWSLLGTWTGSATVTGIAPFPELRFELAQWWLNTQAP
jgi:Uma2 family endonuclease